ncbi:hypothetical protein E4T50_16770 [Aureobasidium sp. EXF-12298]|nr:hypothetical protein E4T50_16770 [Aureobasidium sp. EXF-12298]
MSAEDSSPTLSHRSCSDIADLGPDPPRGRKRKRQGDVRGAEGQEQEERQQRRRLWQGEAATLTTMTDRIREGGRGRSGSHLQSQSPFANRPKLQPTPPSTLLSRSRSRSQSPVRISIRAMETGFPPVRLDLASASSSTTGQPPAVVDRLVDVLVQDSGCAIPTSVRSLFQAHDPRVARQTSDSAFTSDTQLGTKAVWAQVQNIERRANKCFRRHMDEHAWCDVVQLVLQLALGVAGGANPNFALEINNVQSQAVDSAFLPQIRKHDGGGLRHVDKRTDFAIGVDTETGLHIDADPEQLFLSPMTDAYTATLPLVCGLEVKRLDGSEEEAQLQLMVWQTAMLAHLDYLREIGGSPDLPLPPVVAWTVTNHSWRFYVAWKQLDGAVHVMRPFAQSTAASSAGTENTASIFILLKLWTKLISWFETDYYPAYQALLRQADQAQKTIDPLEL